LKQPGTLLDGVIDRQFQVDVAVAEIAVRKVSSPATGESDEAARWAHASDGERA
jgi:hypothetical protein